MPFKSEAQRRKFGELVKKGKVSEDTFKEWNDATPKGKLPERVGKKKAHKSTEDLEKTYKKRFGVK